MVRLVEYPESSDDERDVDAMESDNDSQWSSFDEVPSSPSDSFSYSMRTPESDEEDEDYAPSQGDACSVTSSVDTDDLDPDNEMDATDVNLDTLDGTEQEKVIDLTQEENKGVFYAWKDLSEAFEDNPFKRRSVETKEEVDVTQEFYQQKEAQETEAKKPNVFDVETNKWTFQAAFEPFAPGVADKKTRTRRRTPQHRPTGVSPRFSTLSTGEQNSTAKSDMTAVFPMEQSTTSREKHDGETATFTFPSVEIPDLGTKLTDASVAPKTPDFTFGNTTFSDDTHMRSPSARQTAATPFVPVEGGFTIGRSSKAPKPYNFAGHGGSNTVKLSSKAPPPVQIADDGDDTNMASPSPSPQAKPASQTPTNREFLFGQSYKNRKPFVFSRQNSNGSFQPTGSASIPANTAIGSSWGSKVPIGVISAGRIDINREPTPASAFFSTGVTGPNTHNRYSDRRKKKTAGSTGSAFVSPAADSSSASPFGASSADPTFGSSPSQTATTSRQRQNPSAAPPAAPFGVAEAHENGARISENASAMPSNRPAFGRTDRSFVFDGSTAKTFQPADSSPFGTGVFGSDSNSPATSSTSTSEQVLFGSGTSQQPFQFGEGKNKTQTNGSTFQFSGQPAGSASTSTTDGFQIGSADMRKNSRVRPRRSGMFTNKNSPRKDAKLGATEPEPSPGFSSSSSATPSPFGMHNRRSRKNARLRQYGRSPPADPFVTPTFQSHPTSSEGERRPIGVKLPAKEGISSAFGAPSTGANPFSSEAAQEHGTTNKFGAFQTQQNKASTLRTQSANHSSVFAPNGLTQPAKSNEDTAPPAFAGSRRILRAALRNVGSRGDQVRSAPPTKMGNHNVEGDAEMDSEDERDWEELKRLGGVAHCAKRYEEAAEYYRQSIEVLDSLFYHDAIEDSIEIRTDKAKLHANRAASLMMLMQITEAQHECRRSIEVDATYSRAYLRLGRIQVLLGDTAHAKANLDMARQLMEGHGGEVSSGDQADHASLVRMEATIQKLTVLQGEIKWYIDCGDFKQALVQTESALALAPSSRNLQVQKGQILLHQREFDLLIQFCASIIEKQRSTQRKLSSPASRGGLNARSRKGKTVENITIVGIELGLLWATSLHYQNKVEDAVRILNALEAVAPCSSHVIQLKRQWRDMKELKHNGNERFKRGEYQEAVRIYSEAVQIDPQHQEFCAIIYCNRAAAQMGLERYHTAILDCNEALQRKPNYPRALLRRARCHVALKMHHEAVKDFDRYLREQSNDVPVDATADVRRERNEAKAAIAKAREEARQREAAKKRAEREQRQRRQQRWEEPSWNDSSRFYESYRRNTSSSNNGNSYGSRYQSSGSGGRASFMAPKTQRRTHYDVLGIEKASTIDQIKKAYRKLALVYHPDKAKTSTHADLFKEMTAAYNALSDESARAKYDRELMYNRFGNFYEN